MTEDIDTSSILEQRVNYILSISADKIESTDEKFTMNNLALGDNFKPVDVYFKDVNGNIVTRKHNKGEKKISNQTMPRIAFQVFKKQISDMSVEDKENFPICKYSLEGTTICGIYSSVEEFKNYRNTLEYMQYNYDNNKCFVIYCWNIFSTIIFVQECLKRFGVSGDKFILTYTKKNKNEMAVNDIEIKKQEKYIKEEIIKNQILYGPPGTGKTYNTVLKAMSIINNIEYKDVSDEQYKKLKTKFDEFKQAGQIEFVTFHQSYSYEEFVEGIKPELQNEDNLKYVLENGIFKEICKNATKKITDNFEDVYNNFINEVSKVDEDDFYKLYTLKNHKIFGLQVNGNNNLNIYMTDNFNKQGVITKENLKKHFENMRVARDWINYYDAIIEHLKNNYNLVSENTALKPHVLIIDEINRGNISKIFGELITLIEEDKRENLSVKLPYSQESFTVPKNLYIIGTMNTSDRSIASIDIALRRRFKFKEIMPNPDLIADFGCNFKKCFEVLNKRISILLDRDHQIGHSYFIKTKHKNDSIDELKNIWFDSILPLLNEYFYCDWEKLQAILGQAKNDGTSFIKKIDKISFANNYICDDDENYDFISETECDFECAMKNAFGNDFGA